MTKPSSSNNKKQKTEHSRPSTLRKLEVKPFDHPQQTLTDRAKQMKELAASNTPFLDFELNDIIRSLEHVLPEHQPSDDKEHVGVDLPQLRSFLSKAAHLTHKEWDVTAQNAETLEQLLLPRDAPMNRVLLERIVTEGNWDNAVNKQPWAVLVTGVNGIRKTTSLYQPWFDQLLREALVCPEQNSAVEDTLVLPNGTNAFFRQLDHMIATLVNVEFANLYQLSKQIRIGTTFDTYKLVEDYSNYKAGIFARYRTLSELLGVVLLQRAVSESRSCMLETSGRDVAMFHYVDRFFGPNKTYRKLALHFEINNLDRAKASVDQRMSDEIEIGQHALETGNVFDVIYANKGGPYGSSVLEGIQADSDRVWKSQILSGKVGADWFKATIHITAHVDRPWIAQAVQPDGTLGTSFEFIKP